MALYLTSLLFDGLGLFLDGCTGPVYVITNASRELDDQPAIVGMAMNAVTDAGHRAQAIDVTCTDPAPLAEAGAVVMTGGDPFRLLADLRTSGADGLLRDLHERGIPIAGQSAGAIVCGPELSAIRLTSPFAPPEGLDLTGLGLTDRLILPHHGRPERSALHRQAALTHVPAAAFTPLWDDEAIRVQGAAWQLLRYRGGPGPVRTRRARPADAPSLGDVFHRAALAAWSEFLGRETLSGHRQPESAWIERIEDAGGAFLVTEDDAGLSGFVYWRPLAADPTVGEIDLLYTHPRVWGSGTGRRLLERATWQMLSQGHRKAVLWTEARNDRALAVYRANGWVGNGRVIERDFFGAPIRNLEHRLDLTAYAGGG